MTKFQVFRGSKDGVLQQSTTEKTIGADEVLLRVTHSGLCFTDVHFKHSDMGLGHEGVGVVEEIGEKVTLFEKYCSLI